MQKRAKTSKFFRVGASDGWHGWHGWHGRVTKIYPCIFHGWHGWQTYILEEKTEFEFLLDIYVCLSCLPWKIQGQIFVSRPCLSCLPCLPSDAPTLKNFEVFDICCIFWTSAYCFIPYVNGYLTIRLRNIPKWSTFLKISLSRGTHDLAKNAA